MLKVEVNAITPLGDQLDDLGDEKVFLVSSKCLGQIGPSTNGPNELGTLCMAGLDKGFDLDSLPVVWTDPFWNVVLHHLHYGCLGH